jgi:hypothetical protein
MVKRESFAICKCNKIALLDKGVAGCDGSAGDVTQKQGASVQYR